MSFVDYLLLACYLHSRRARSIVSSSYTIYVSQREREQIWFIYLFGLSTKSNICPNHFRFKVKQELKILLLPLLLLRRYQTKVSLRWNMVARIGSATFAATKIEKTNQLMHENLPELSRKTQIHCQSEAEGQRLQELVELLLLVIYRSTQCGQVMIKIKTFATSIKPH